MVQLACYITNSTSVFVSNYDSLVVTHCCDIQYMVDGHPSALSICGATGRQKQKLYVRRGHM